MKNVHQGSVLSNKERNLIDKINSVVWLEFSNRFSLRYDKEQSKYVFYDYEEGICYIDNSMIKDKHYSCLLYLVIDRCKLQLRED